MKLTDISLRWARRLPKGNIFRGKERLVKPVTPKHLAMKKEAYEIEEKNMFYLRHPYLTREQDYGHAKTFNHKKIFLEKMKENKINNWRDHKLLGDRFGFLKVSEKWD